MKTVLPYLCVFFTLMACNNQAAKEQANFEKTEQDIAINRIIGIGKISPENDIIQLSSPVNGIVKNIFKKENDTVNIGTVILALDHDLEDAKMIQQSVVLKTQAAKLKSDAASVQEYFTKVSNAKSVLARLQNLLDKGAETQQTVDDASTNLKALTANLNRLEADVLVSKNKIQENKAALKIAEIERDQKIIKSPIRGRILELTVLVGGSVSIQDPFAQINPMGKTIAICEIDEANAGNIKVGQKGWIRNVGASDTLSTGTVYFAFSFLKKKSLFTDQSGEKEDRRVRTIKMLLDHPENLLLNKRVECVIDISNNLKK